MVDNVDHYQVSFHVDVSTVFWVLFIPTSMFNDQKHFDNQYTFVYRHISLLRSESLNQRVCWFHF